MGFPRFSKTISPYAAVPFDSSSSPLAAPEAIFVDACQFSKFNGGQKEIRALFNHIPRSNLTTLVVAFDGPC